MVGTWVLFLESPGNFLGPEYYFKITIYRMVVKLLVRRATQLVSSTYSFTT